MRNLFVAVFMLFSGMSLSAADPAPSGSPWVSSAGAGLAVTSGNTDTRNYNLSASTKYDPKTRFVFKADALYLRGESGGTTQVDKTTAGARGDYSISDRTFAFGEVSYLRDPFKDFSYYVAPIAGAGYRVVKTPAYLLTVDGGAGAVLSSGPLAGRSTSGALKAGQGFEWTISPASKLTEKLTGTWKTDDFADSLYHFDAGLTTSIAARADLKLAWVYDFRNRTVAPVKKGDSAFFAALLFKF